jgi:addiction module RelE/StbE family toxin
MTKYRVVWDIHAKKSLSEIYKYISKDSPAAAVKVRNELLKLAASLQKMPMRFSTEPYSGNRGTEYRSVTKWSYKIIYTITAAEVTILRLVHTSRESSGLE